METRKQDLHLSFRAQRKSGMKGSCARAKSGCPLSSIFCTSRAGFRFEGILCVSVSLCLCVSFRFSSILYT